MGEIATGDGRRRRRHLLDRTNAETDDPPGDDAEDAEHEPGDDHLHPDQPAHRCIDIGQRERGDGDAVAIATDAEDAVPGVRRRIGSDRERLARGRALDRLARVDRGNRRSAGGEGRRHHCHVGAVDDAEVERVARPRRRASWRSAVLEAPDRGSGRGELRVDPFDEVGLGAPRDDHPGHDEHDADHRHPDEQPRPEGHRDRQLARRV